MEDLERRLATALLDYGEIMKRQATRLRWDEDYIEDLKKEIRLLRKENSKQAKSIEELRLRNKFLGVSKEIKN